jgi:hypothetical protein
MTRGPGRISDLGFRIADSTSIREPEVAVFGERLVIIVEDEGVPAVVHRIFEVAFVEFVFVGLG